ncbi:hypothetical protein Gotur_035554 [Gossypium turneri]
MAGPFKSNGVPLRCVNQSYFIATSTKVDISGVNVDKFDDKYFAKEVEKRKKKTEGEFFEAEKETTVDTSLIKSNEGVLDLKAYLATRFSLKSGMKPHELFETSKIDLDLLVSHANTKRLQPVSGLLSALLDDRLDVEGNTSKIRDIVSATRILKKKKLKINVHRPGGTRVVFDEEGNTQAPLAMLADKTSGDIRLDQGIRYPFCWPMLLRFFIFLEMPESGTHFVGLSDHLVLYPLDIEGVVEDSISSSWKSQGLVLLQVECYLMLHSMVVYLSWNLNLVLLKQGFIATLQALLKVMIFSGVCGRNVAKCHILAAFVVKAPLKTMIFSGVCGRNAVKAHDL